jgi:hypothetical protein
MVKREWKIKRIFIEGGHTMWPSVFTSSSCMNLAYDPRSRWCTTLSGMGRWAQRLANEKLVSPRELLFVAKLFAIPTSLSSQLQRVPWGIRPRKPYVPLNDRKEHTMVTRALTSNGRARWRSTSTAPRRGWRGIWFPCRVRANAVACYGVSLIIHEEYVNHYQ